MQLKRKEDGTLVLVINLQGSTEPLYEVEPHVNVLGPCISFYRVIDPDGEGTPHRTLLLTLSRNGGIGLLRFLPALLNEAARMERRVQRNPHS
jgi:hypothetical protein